MLKQATRLAKLVFIIFFVFGAVSPLLAQLRTLEFPQHYGDETLRGISLDTRIAVLVDGQGEAWDAWSSSFLKEDGQPPAKPAAVGNTDVDSDIAQQYNLDMANWKTMYSARSLMDNNPATCWSEAVAGSGIGEVVLAKVTAAEGLLIRSGYQQSEDLFRKNARPRQVRVWLLAAGSMDYGQFDTIYYDIQVVSVVDAELKDSMGWQVLPTQQKEVQKTRIAGMDQSQSRTEWFVAVQLLSVYPGERWQDCCISDIAAIGTVSETAGYLLDLPRSEFDPNECLASDSAERRLALLDYASLGSAYCAFAEVCDGAERQFSLISLAGRQYALITRPNANISAGNAGLGVFSVEDGRLQAYNGHLLKFDPKAATAWLQQKPEFAEVFTFFGGNIPYAVYLSPASGLPYLGLDDAVADAVSIRNLGEFRLEGASLVFP